MRIFRSIALSLAMACGAIFGMVAMVMQPVLCFVSDVCLKAVSGLDKLDRELAQKFAEKVRHGAGVNSDLKRESNGFRQSSADEYEGFAPTSTVS